MPRQGLQRQKSNKAQSTHINAFRPSVHTNTLSVFIETHRFENALESGSKLKRMHFVIVLAWIGAHTASNSRTRPVLRRFHGPLYV